MAALVPRGVRRQFPAEAGSARAARVWSEPVLRTWGMNGSTSSALIVISELVTNAIVHGHDPIEVSMTCRDGSVRVAVSDGGGGAVAPADPAEREVGGHGLHLVEAMSLAWGVDDTPAGKTVWADLGLDDKP